MPFSLFIVDDDPEYSALLQFQLRKLEDANIQVFARGEHAIDSLDRNPDLVLLDLVMPGQGGLETLRQLKIANPELNVIVLSSQTVVSVALEALKLGAYDYITKGHDDTVKIRRLVHQFIERKRLSGEVELLREQLRVPHGIPGMIGESAGMGKVLRMIKKTLIGDLSVAVVGESGTGKELVAHTIHYNSPRRREPFIVVNCAAIPRDLMESEFFGHEKGSFTGAHARKTGKFEQANRGTIFLDEVGELNLDLQAKLLRVLQNHEVQRVGSSETIRVDVRVVCATNQDIPKLIKESKFREDLYYRLFQFPIQLPPLRERDQDALLLAKFFREDFLKRHKDVKPREFSAATSQLILEYSWPGNVRQLKNAVERGLLISDSEQIIPEDLMLELTSIVTSKETTNGQAETISDMNPLAAIKSEDGVTLLPQQPDEICSLEDIKRTAVLQAYKVCEGNVDQTSIRLGITRSTVYRLLEKYKKEGFSF